MYVIDKRLSDFRKIYGYIKEGKKYPTVKWTKDMNKKNSNKKMAEKDVQA